MSKWLWRANNRPRACLRLYCFPHAGAGASAFASWVSAAPSEIEIAPVQLPGRETRLDEEPQRSFVPAAEAIAEVISISDPRPFALFGHSVGGKLAVHVASLLDQTDRRPTELFISATPTVPRERHIHKLSGAEFVRAIADRFGAIPTQITDDREIWDLFERPLRADLEAHETDTLPPRRLDAPLTVIWGRQDRVVDRHELTDWCEWSTRPVNYEVLEVDHFSYRSKPQAYLKVITGRLFAARA
ncbi:MAG TPA: alpha/beta fold hydrolase [Xanthobacteraceae bacterium]|nr:alpha/beta fold hydrolase [Xanthobacteraceae bacterium]